MNCQSRSEVQMSRMSRYRKSVDSFSLLSREITQLYRFALRFCLQELIFSARVTRDTYVMSPWLLTSKLHTPFTWCVVAGDRFVSYMCWDCTILPNPGHQEDAIYLQPQNSPDLPPKSRNVFLKSDIHPLQSDHSCFRRLEIMHQWLWLCPGAGNLRDLNPEPESWTEPGAQSKPTVSAATDCTTTDAATVCVAHPFPSSSSSTGWVPNYHHYLP